MDARLWEPDRLASVGYLLSRYSAHLEKDDRIRVGQEGDGMSIYRSAEDAPVGTVTEVHRDANGYVTFRAVMDGSGALVDFDNRNVSPDRIWEIEPSYLDTFRERVFRGQEEGGDAASPEDGAAPPEDGAAPPEDGAAPASVEEVGYRAVQGDLEDLQRRVESMESNVQARIADVERTVTEVVRELSSDIINAGSGRRAEFAYRYADRYDEARRISDAQEERFADPRDEGAAQREKYNFEVPVESAGSEASLQPVTIYKGQSALREDEVSEHDS